MKKKIFTLLTLALVSIGSAWGQDVIFSYDASTKDNITYTEGSTITTSCSQAKSSNMYGIKFDGTNSSMRIELPTGVSINENDAINITLYQAETSSPDNNYGFYIGASSTTNESTPKVTLSSEDEKSVKTKTINITSTSELKDVTTFFVNGIFPSGKKVMLQKIIISRSKTVTSETLAATNAVKVDDTAMTKDAATNGYSVSGTTITLSDDVTALSTPDNVKLVKTVTYDDSSTNEDVDVTFDGTVTAGYFIGTATIGLAGSEVSYTVRVKKDVTPTLNLSASSGSINLKSYEATGTAKVTLTGANLANGTFNAPTASGVTVTPATVDITDGTIDQEFTITPSATTAAETVLAFAYTGATTQNYTLNYSKTAQRSVTQTTVSEATTWDWTYAGDETIQLNENTSPTNEDEFVMADIEEVNNTSQFKSQALKVVCQFPTRGTNHYLQGNSVKFMTAVPGTVQVYFSNTSTREDNATNRRYLYINGVNSGVYTLNQSFENTSMAVPVGEVVINAYTGEETPAATMVRINKIVFTPLASGDVVEVTTAAYATHVLADDIDFTATSDVKAYAAKVEGDKITLTEVSAAPKGTPLVIAATKDVYTLTKAATTPAAVTDNDLVAGPVTGDGSSYYVLGKDADGKLGFGLLASGSTLPGTKAYIPASKFTSAPSFAYFDGETTGVSEVRSQKEDVRGEYFNLNGQRVAQPTKGLYIVNGRKVVVK